MAKDISYILELINKVIMRSFYKEEQKLELFTNMIPDYGQPPKKPLFAGKKYNDELALYEKNKADFQLRRKQDIQANINAIPQMLDSLLENIEQTLSKADTESLVVNKNNATLRNLFKFLDFVTTSNSTQSKPLYTPTNEQMAKIYAISMATFIKSNELYEKNPNMRFWVMTQNYLGYTFDTGYLATFAKNNNLPLTKNDYDIMHRFLRTTSSESRDLRGFYYEKDYSNQVDSNIEFWAKLGINIEAIKNKYAIKDKETSSKAYTQTSQSKPEASQYSTSTSSTSSNSQSQNNPTQSKLTASQLLRNAYLWYDKFCQDRITEQIQQGTAKKINDYGVYNVTDPTGSMISFNYRTGYAPYQLKNNGRMKPDGTTMRTSKDLMKELAIIEEYVKTSGEIPMSKVSNNIGGITITKTIITDESTRLLLTSLGNTYTSWIREAKECESSMSTDGM